MRKLSTHAEWLRLVEVSGPFISTTMLERAFPQGLESTDTPRRQRLRSAYEEWRDAVDEIDPQLTELHREWVRLVLEDILEYDKDILVGREDFGSAYVCRAPECAVTFVPDLAVIAVGDERPRFLISIQPPDVDLEKVQVNDGWPVLLVERMILLCRSTGVRLGLVTNGERWMLVNAPIGSASSHISWYSRLWFQEPVTLKAFLSLLGVRRCFGPAEETLDALLEESLKHHEEVTDTLGEQVRRAVEVLVQCLDKADQDRNRELLYEVSPAELYEAGLTIMMRLVFVLCAEERGLLLLDDPVYDQYYAISTLRGQLAEDADRHGPEVLDRRHDAWARLLAVFRAIYSGIDHESLRMPALGGSLFDPDRFPFLEGRGKGTKWRETTAAPLPIDNRTVLLLLEALQLLEQTGGALLLSYKALDVENIGHVYEGLLENTVSRVPEVTLGLIGSQNAKCPNITLRELEEALASSSAVLQKLLEDITKRSESAIRNSLSKCIDDSLASSVLTVCGGDTKLTQRILSFANLLRTDAWNDPIVYRANSFTVTIGANRRDTGTHYTPKSLTETIVTTTLETVVYIGPAEGKAREDWKLKTPEEILELKVCDPAMGSGAFLVQACRYLSQRLVESWGEQEEVGRYVTTDGEVVERLNDKDPLPTYIEDRLMIAKRLIAERCIYGVDLNPMAVELGKLSIWLITMAKGYPFGFLDHNLRSGNSLLGIHRLEQLTELSMTPTGKGQLRLFGQSIGRVVTEAIKLRQRLREMPIRDVQDVEAMTRLDIDARQKLEVAERIADAFIGEVFVLGSNATSIKNAITSLAIQAGQAIDGDQDAISLLIERAVARLVIDIPADKSSHKPFHWPLEFPEVFACKKMGFDSIIGNPPFLGGTRISGAMGGRFRDYLANTVAENGGGQADLIAYFFIRSTNILANEGVLGLLATNSIAEGDTRQVGLESLLTKSGVTIICAYPNEPWPGKAAVVTSRVHIKKGIWRGQVNLSGRRVNYISPFLSDVDEWSLKPLTANANLAFEGSYTFGDGFTLDEEDARQMLASDPNNKRVIFQYINGKELNSAPRQSPGRWVINFFDWSENEAKKYVLPYSKILEDVKKERANTKNLQVREYPWWLHWRPRPALYHAIGRGEEFNSHPREWKLNSEKPTSVLVSCRVSKHSIFCFIPNEYIYSNAINVFALREFFHFAVLQSSIHSVFVWKYASKMKNDIRYTPGDVFIPFPWPEFSSLNELDSLGCAYHAMRSDFLSKNEVGLTKFYNLFHSSKNNSAAIHEVRDAHRKIDNALMQAYGWADIELDHDFHEVPYLPENDRLRFTISESSRIEILTRLALLNKERYEEEHKDDQPSGRPRSSSGKAKTTKKSMSSLSQQTLELE